MAVVILTSCPRCGGSGEDPENVREVERVCPSCGGYGVDIITREMSIDAYGDASAQGQTTFCSRCGGQGGWTEPQPDACSRCEGRGEVAA